MSKKDKNTILYIAGGLFLFYLLTKNKSVGNLPRGYLIKQEIDNRSGCHKNEVKSVIKRAV